MRKGLNKKPYIFCLFFLLSCSKDKSLDGPFNFVFVENPNLLKDYMENNTVLYDFTYNNKNNLTENNIYNPEGTTTYDFIYDQENRPDTIAVKTPSYNYYLIPAYQDTLLLELDAYYNNQFEFKYVFRYDSIGRIRQVSRYGNSLNLFANSLFTWEGNNIKKYEIQFLYVSPPIIYDYEYEYDNKINPFRKVYKGFNYNLIEYLPISENNWVSMIGYNKDYPDNKLSVKNVFDYTGPGYPFVKSISATSYSGTVTDIYAEYHY